MIKLRQWEVYKNNISWRLAEQLKLQREMHLSFRNSQNCSCCVCPGPALTLPFFLSLSVTLLSTTKNWFLLHEGRVATKEPEFYKLWFPSPERNQLSSSLPFTKSPGLDSFWLSFGHVLTSRPITCGQSEAESWKKQGGSWVIHGWSWGRSSSQRRKHCYGRRGEYRTEETT